MEYPNLISDSQFFISLILMYVIEHCHTINQHPNMIQKDIKEMLLNSFVGNLYHMKRYIFLSFMPSWSSSYPFPLTHTTRWFFNISLTPSGELNLENKNRFFFRKEMWPHPLLQDVSSHLPNFPFSHIQRWLEGEANSDLWQKSRWNWRPSASPLTCYLSNFCYQLPQKLMKTEIYRYW